MADNQGPADNSADNQGLMSLQNRIGVTSDYTRGS